MRRLVYVRRVVATLALAGAVGGTAAVWSDAIVLHASTAAYRSQIPSIVGVALGVTANLVAIALAVALLTAQLSSSGSRPSILTELYRSREIYFLFGCGTLTVITGYVTLAMGPEPIDPILYSKLSDLVLIFSLETIVLICPALMAQLENLDPIVLAAKLNNKLTPDAIKDYGLTKVVATASGTISYQINIVGLRPRGIDPLRPLHELLMEAVHQRDRVLFGKLFRYLLEPIAVVHGAYWDELGIRDPINAPGVLRRLRGRAYTAEDRVHVALALLHYAVKRARNLLSEWEHRDIGRHGIITCIGDLICALAANRTEGPTVRIGLYATLHISRTYADVKPYGRIEPLTTYLMAASELEKAGKDADATLCMEVLGWVSVHCEHISGGRCLGLFESISKTLMMEFDEAQTRARADAGWLPGRPSEDPWRSWPDSA